jgi:Ni/Co efflux regulator RcnB
MDEHSAPPDADADDPEFDTEAAAEFLGCSPGYLANLRSWGTGPRYHRKFKRRGIIYLRSDLKAYKLRSPYLSTTEY